MKTNLMKYSLVLSAYIFLASCSKSPDQLSSKPETNKEVIIYDFGTQTVTGKLTLTPSVSDLTGDTAFLTNRTPLLFFKLEDDEKWYSFMAPPMDQDLRFTSSLSAEGEHYQFVIRVTKGNLEDLYESPLKFTAFKLIAPLYEDTKSLTRQDVDFGDYNAVIDYFKLRN